MAAGAAAASGGGAAAAGAGSVGGTSAGGATGAAFATVSVGRTAACGVTARRISLNQPSGTPRVTTPTPTAAPAAAHAARRTTERVPGSGTALISRYARTTERRVTRGSRATNAASIARWAIMLMSRGTPPARLCVSRSAGTVKSRVAFPPLATPSRWRT